MTHDPMCPYTDGKAHPLWKAAAPVHELLCQCNLIAAVRADERRKHEPPKPAGHPPSCWCARCLIADRLIDAPPQT